MAKDQDDNNYNTEKIGKRKTRYTQKGFSLKVGEEKYLGGRAECYGLSKVVYLGSPAEDRFAVQLVDERHENSPPCYYPFSTKELKYKSSAHFKDSEYILRVKKVTPEKITFSKIETTVIGD